MQRLWSLSSVGEKMNQYKIIKLNNGFNVEADCNGFIFSLSFKNLGQVLEFLIVNFSDKKLETKDGTEK